MIRSRFQSSISLFTKYFQTVPYGQGTEQVPQGAYNVASIINFMQVIVSVAERGNASDNWNQLAATLSATEGAEIQNMRERWRPSHLLG